MAGASANQARVVYVPETTPGEIPANPAWTEVRFQRWEINAEPIVDITRSLQYGGAAVYAHRYGLRVAGQADAELAHGVYEIFLQSLLGSAWSSDALIDGLDRYTFAVEEDRPWGPVASRYYRYRGVEVTAATITMAARQPVRLNMRLAGVGADPTTASELTGATYADAADVRPYSSGSDIGTVEVLNGGTPMTLPCISRASIQIETGRREQPRIGSDDLCGISRGRPTVTVDAEIYHETGVQNLRNLLFNGNDVGLNFVIGNTSGQKLQIQIPRAQVVQADGSPLEPDADIFTAIRFQALYSVADGYAIRITRNVT